MAMRSVIQRNAMHWTKWCGIRKIWEGAIPRNGNLLMLQDMRKEDFEEVSERLGKKYLEEAKEIPAFPVHGMIYGNQFGRKCVLLTVQRNNKRIWVPFVLNGGSPNNILGRDAILALGLNDVRQAINVNIHGFDTLIAYHEPEDEKLKNINIIGWTFFRDTRCFEYMEAETKTLRLYENLQQFMNETKSV